MKYVYCIVIYILSGITIMLEILPFTSFIQDEMKWKSPHFGTDLDFFL